MKKLLKVLLILLLIVVLALGGLLAFLSAAEYKPKAVEPVDVKGAGTGAVPAQNLRILCWNIGYGGLGAAEDFFMDGGTRARPDSPETVSRYLEGIRHSIDADRTKTD